MNIIIIFILFIILILILCFIILQVQNNKYGGGQKYIKQMPNNLYAMSYTISGEDNGLDYSQLRQLFKVAELKYNNEIKFIEKPVTEKVHISFGTFGNFIINGKLCEGYTYDPEFIRQKSAIKNVLGNFQSIIDKSKLYNTVQKIMPTALKYLPNSYSDKEFEHKMNHSNMFQNTIYIVKKDNESQQRGVIIITSKQEYSDAKEKLRKLEIARVKLKKVKPSYEIIINEYITNPLLIDGKKFHLRVYFLLSIVSGITRCSFYRQYRISTAKLPYIKEDWYNGEIHLSGGNNTEKKYEYLEHFKKEHSEHFHTIEKNLNICNKTICIIMTMANIKNYPESYAGYHLYAADIMLTDEYHPYLLEINSKPAFTFGEFSKFDTTWGEYNKQFSNQLFSFILNSTSFPSLGIKRPPIYDAEFIEKGALAPFGKILTGDNKCFFIPYLDATEEEIKAAEEEIKAAEEEIKAAKVAAIVDNCSYINIFLIAKSLPKISSAQNIIGYLALDNHHYLKIFIIENYRNQGIGSAMIAQFLEIHYMRYYTAHHIPIVKIKKTNTFLDKIAKKLHFHINANRFEYNFSNKI